MTYRMHLANTTEILLEEIADPRMKRKDVAVTYGLAIRSADETDWPRVNAAIIERWSKAALNTIKKWAWEGPPK